MNSKLPERLRLLRAEKDYTQLDLAKVLGMTSKSTVSSYESGRNTPDDEIKMKIAKHFDVSLDWLIGYSDIKKTYSQEQAKKIEDVDKIMALLESKGFVKPGTIPTKEEIDKLLKLLSMAIDMSNV